MTPFLTIRIEKVPELLRDFLRFRAARSCAETRMNGGRAARPVRRGPLRSVERRDKGK